MQTINEKLASKEALLECYNAILDKQHKIGFEIRYLKRLNKDYKKELGEFNGIQKALNVIKERIEGI
jgi:hypothetical protein